MLYALFAVLSVAFLTLWIVTGNKGWAGLLAVTIQFAVTTFFQSIIADSWIIIVEQWVFWIVIVCWFVTLILIERKAFSVLSTIALLISAVTFFVLLIAVSNGSTHPADASPSPSVSVSDNSASTKVDKILHDAGWVKTDYRLAAIDPSIDKSTSASGAFTTTALKNAEDTINFLKSGTKSADALFIKILDATNATTKEVLNESNWVAVQSLTDFNYPGNTLFKDGTTVNAGRRNGSAGDIFLVFVSPTTGKFIAVRGACGNPQTFVPVPNNPVPSPSPSTSPRPSPSPSPTPSWPPYPSPSPSWPPYYPSPSPKSPDPSDYPPPSAKPPVSASPSSDTTPPVVITVTQNPNGIVDSSTKSPGSETGVTAPSASPASTSPKPSAEPSVNPSTGNNGTGVNPFQ